MSTVAQLPACLETRIGTEVHLNAFENALRETAAEKIELKSEAEKLRLKRRIATYRRSLDRICMAKTLAASSNLRLIDVLADMDAKNGNKTKRAIKQLRDEMMYAKFKMLRVE